MPKRVLYIHGLEGGPDSEKPVELRKMAGEEFELHCPDMSMSKYDLRKSNSVLRNLTRHPLARALVAWLTLGVILAAYRGSYHFAAIVSVTFGLIARQQYPKLQKSCVARSIDGCLAVCRQAIDNFEPDLVIGSSWGGGLTCILLAQGHLKVPVLLLAPALKRMCLASGNDRYNFDATLKKVHAAAEKQKKQPAVRIIHGDRDSVVPLSDSRDLVGPDSEPKRVLLEVVAKGDHGMKKLPAATRRRGWKSTWRPDEDETQWSSAVPL